MSQKSESEVSKLNPRFLKNSLAIFGPFLELQEFFKNRGLNFETSDADFCDLLDELFPMNN